MDIGKQSLRGTLKSPPSGQDAQGQASGAWTQVATGVWAQPVVQRGTSRIFSGTVADVTPVVLRFRPRAGMAAGWKFVADNGTVFDFRDVPPNIGRVKFVDVVCVVVQ